MKTIKIILFATFLLFGLSCKKETVTGPQGEKGEQGNTNVQSEYQTVYSSEWIYDSIEKLYRATIFDSDITQSIIDKGMVVVSLVADERINIPLPVTFTLNYPNSTDTYSSTMLFAYEKSKVYITVQDSDLTQPNNPGSGTFRIVKIAGAFLQQNPNLETKDLTQLFSKISSN